MLIYKITNEINGKVYIGQTVRSLQVRISEYRRKSVTGTYPIYLAMRKYGFDNFTFEVQEVVGDVESLNSRERYWVRQYRSNESDYGYNQTDGGDNGKTLTEEVKRKISESRKGKRPSQETCRRISESKTGKPNGNNGKPCSLETREKIRNAHLGRSLTDEQMTNLRNAMKHCKRHSAESYQKSADARKKRIDSDVLLSLIASGKTSKEIGEVLGMGFATVCKRTRELF